MRAMQETTLKLRSRKSSNITRQTSFSFSRMARQIPAGLQTWLFFAFAAAFLDGKRHIEGGKQCDGA